MCIPTLRKFTQHSISFRITLYCLIFIFLTTVILMIASTFFTCISKKYYKSCTDVPLTTLGYYCIAKEIVYCCNYFDYDYCGDSYCKRLDSLFTKEVASCKVIDISIIACFALSGLLLVTLLLLCCFLRNKIDSRPILKGS